jgi:hypothetical protein
LICPGSAKKIKPLIGRIVVRKESRENLVGRTWGKGPAFLYFPIYRRGVANLLPLMTQEKGSGQPRQGSGGHRRRALTGR